MGPEITGLANSGKVMGTKLTRNEIDQKNRLIDAGIYLNSSDFIREAVSEKRTAIKVIEYRDVDFETAKKDVSCYFRMKGDAYASDVSTDLELDYDLVCKIMDELEKEGKLEAMV